MGRIVHRYKLSRPETAGEGTYVKVVCGNNELTSYTIPVKEELTFDEIIFVETTFEGRRSLCIHLMEVQ